MNTTFFSRRLQRLLLLVAAVGMLGTTALAIGAAAPANTQITNQASVSYEDSVGNTYSATSNDAVITVKQIYSATLAQDDRSVVSAPAQTVYFTHTITNGGNGTDVFDVTVTDANDASTATDGLDFTSISVYQDGGANCAGANGQVDPAEVLLDTKAAAAVSTVSIDAGDQACLVVAATLPATATGGSEYDLTVQVLAREGTGAGVAGSVTDLTTGKGDDSADDTNQDAAKVTTGPALQINKQSVHNTATSTVTYTIEVRNTGAEAATNVVIFDGYPANTNLSSAITSTGFSNALDASDTAAANIATLQDETTLDAAVGVDQDLNGDGDATDTTEIALDIDLNNDGSKNTDAIPGFIGLDGTLPINTTITVSYSVSYNATALGAGYVIKNTARVCMTDAGNDIDLDANPDCKTSNETNDPVPQVYAVQITDTGTDASNNVNDGGDDDATANEVQSVDQANEGDLVLFNNIVTNNGNGNDTLELSIANDGGAAANGSGIAYLAAISGGTACDGSAARQFPSGTVFTIADKTTNAPLSNTNGLLDVDTGVLAQNASLNIVVRAKLPPASNGAGEYCASIQVKSAGDATKTDYKMERLGRINAPSVDLANTDNSAGSGDADGFDPSTTITDASATTTVAADIGDLVTFDLWIRNDGGSSESFDLEALGGIGTVGDTTPNAIAANFTVVFTDQDSGNSIPDGSVITTTDNVPPGGSTKVRAEIQVPSDATLTLADYLADLNDDASANASDKLDDTKPGGVTPGSGDGDGDYGFIFRVTGNNSGAQDVKLDAIDVNDVELITLTPNNNGQVEPGGTITYTHTLANKGNTLETVFLSVATSSTDFDTSLLKIDTDNNGSYDTFLTALADGSTVTMANVNGGTNTISVSNDASGISFVNMNPGDTLPIQNVVTAKTSAAAGTQNTDTLTASYNAKTSSVTAQDVTTVVTTQIRATKTVAPDIDCNGTPDEAFKETATTTVAPGKCAVWQIVLKNESSQIAKNVVLTDAAPPFTSYLAGSMTSCTKDTGISVTADASMNTHCTAVGGVSVDHTDGSDDETNAGNNYDASESSGAVTFYVGSDDAGTGGATEPDNTTGGTLSPGEAITVRFSVQLDQ